MPELPEVETLRRELARVLPGRVFAAVKILWPGTVKQIEPKKFAARLRGRKILAVERRAKILIFKLSGGECLLIHLKLTGQLIFAAGDKLVGGGHPENPAKYTRVIFTFTDPSGRRADGAKLLFNDLRKFGWLKLASASEAEKILGGHGVEPLSREFNLEKFSAILNRYPKRKLKSLLLDQTLIAGLGNIYADESCFAAGLRPTRLVERLTSNNRKKLHQAIIAVLKLSIRKKGTSYRDYRRSTGARGGFVPHLNVYGRGGAECKKCGGVISKIKLNGRGTHFCPRCQR